MPCLGTLLRSIFILATSSLQTWRSTKESSQMSTPKPQPQMFSFLRKTRASFFLHLQVNSVCCKSIKPLCSSVAKLCPTLCNPMDCSTPGFSVLHHLPELAQTHVHWVSDAIQLSHPQLPPSHPALSLSQHQGLFQWVSSSHQVDKGLEL